MARGLKPLLGKKDASRRPLSGDKDTTRAHLTLVRSYAHYPHPHHGMWFDDPIEDPTVHTRLEDWPTESDFEPLIALARAAEDHLLVAQLEADRAFCGAARKNVISSQERSEDTSA